MTQQTRISRRRFLALAGGAVMTSALCCGGLTIAGLEPSAVEFKESSCGGGKDMIRILVAYASKCGSTGEVAQAIRQALCNEGAAVDVRRVQDVKDLTGYGAVVLGSAIRMGKPLPDAVKFARKHQASLAGMPVAYFIACATMKEDTPENRAEASAYLDPLREIAAPVDVGLFGGKVDHSKLSPLLRFAVSRDASGQMAEGDWRDWQAIGDWAVGLRPALLAT
jgi:menaquinone-dependent protoporphyrinogen oxidase